MATNWCMMNTKGRERKRSRPNRRIITALAWMEWGKSGKPLVRTASRSGFDQSTSRIRVLSITAVPTRSVLTILSCLWNEQYHTTPKYYIPLPYNYVRGIPRRRTAAWPSVSWDNKIWWRVLQDSEPRMTVLARPSSNLPSRRRWDT
jgi:hypothetical protein